MKSLIFTVALVAAPLALADAAGPFDGTYSGGAPAVGHTCPSFQAKGTIKDGKLAGKYEFLKYSYGFGGTVAADGTVTGRWGAYPFAGKIAGGHLTGSYSSKECGADRPVSLDKTQ